MEADGNGGGETPRRGGGGGGDGDGLRPSLGAVCDNCGASHGSGTGTQHCGECGALLSADEEQEMEECDALEAEQLFGQTRSHDNVKANIQDELETQDYNIP